MRVVPDLVEADQLIGERGRVLIGGRAGRDPGRRGRWGGFLRRVERLVEVGPRGWMMAGRVVKVVEGVQRVLHGGDRVYRDGGDRRERRAAVRVMIGARLGRLLPRIVLDRLATVAVAGQQHLRILVLMVVGVVMGQPVVKIADHRVRAHFRPVVVLMMGRHRVDRRPQPRPDDGRSLVRPLRVFLHVLGQIRLLGVTLAAVLADVRLKVLRFLVLRYVLEQAGLVGEALVARVTLVRLVGLVTAGVALQVAQLAERLGAAWMPALVRFVTGVRADVLL